METSGSTFIEESDKNPGDRRDSMKTCIDQNMRITSGVFKKLQDHLKAEYRKGSIHAVNPRETDTVFAEQIKTLHKNALEDLTYLSLALIQKSNFDETLSAYRNYIFPPRFLERTMLWLQR
jgi:intergrase/recombinase